MNYFEDLMPIVPASSRTKPSALSLNASVTVQRRGKLDDLCGLLIRQEMLQRRERPDTVTHNSLSRAFERVETAR
eukprot:3372240-Amphidinium_carterae.2